MIKPCGFLPAPEMYSILRIFFIKLDLNFMAPFSGWGSTILRLQSCYEETVYYYFVIILIGKVFLLAKYEEERKIE